MIGRTISHYKILEKLGEGGMGVVYKAEDITLGRQVALKFLSAQTISGEADKSRFAREAKAAASLSHPNVATIYEFAGVDDPVSGKSTSFIAMEFVDGQMLSHMIGERPLPVHDVIDIATAVAEALSKAQPEPPRLP